MKQVSIEIIQTCLNECLYCSSQSGPTCTEKIGTEQVLRVLDGCRRLDAETVCLSGGEPFLHEGLEAMVRYAKSLGLEVFIYTSGVCAPGGEAVALPEEQLLRLRTLGLDKIIFDFPAADEAVYDRLLGVPGRQPLAVESIRRAKAAGLCTELHMVPSKLNADQVEKIMAFAAEHRLNRASFLGLIPHGRAADCRELLYLDREESDALKRKLRRLSGPEVRVGIPLQLGEDEGRCFAGTGKLHVRYDGLVFGCEAFKHVRLTDAAGRPVEPDSIYRREIDEICRDSPYLKLEQAFVEARMAEGCCAEQCPVQRMHRSAEDRGG